MAVLCPGRKTRMALDIIAFILCLLLAAGQLAVLDYYFIHYLKEEWWYSWIAGDVLVLIVFVTLVILAVRYNQRSMEEFSTVDGSVKYAFLAWFVYSGVLAGKVAVTFRLFKEDIKTTHPGEEEIAGEDPDDELKKIFNQHTYKLILSLSGPVFLLLLEAHHYTQNNSPRQLYLTYVVTAIVADILDTILFLELLWNEEVWKAVQTNEFALEISILVLVCLNLVLPTFALLKLRFKKMPSWLPLPYEKLYALLYVLVVNVPFLTIRAYLWYVAPKHSVSIFMAKNACFIYLAIRELWIRFQYHRQKKAMPTTPAAVVLTQQQDTATAGFTDDKLPHHH